MILGSTLHIEAVEDGFSNVRPWFVLGRCLAQGKLHVFLSRQSFIVKVF